MATDTLIIFGAKSTALEIAELARSLDPNWDIVHVVGDADTSDVHGLVRVGQLADYLKGMTANLLGIISMADPEMRKDRVALMEQCGIEPVTLIHRSATVSPSASIGKGCYIAAGARVSVNAKVGHHCMLNLNTTTGHDVVMGDHCVINPGAAISGNVMMGDRVLIGANSFIHQGLSIGDDCQIDAMTHVSRDIPANHMATSRSLKVLKRL
jgi:sugar O-acyltransferase (sialic acid O-acetyltransferase NeuD family)